MKKFIFIMCYVFLVSCGKPQISESIRDPNFDFVSFAKNLAENNPDAANPSQAVGYIKIRSEFNKKILLECSNMFGVRAPAYKNSYHQWSERERAILEKVELYWSRGAGKEHDSAQVIELLKNKIFNEILKQANKYSNEHSVSLEYSLLNYCDNHFIGLDNGSYRRRAPKAYEYLEASLNLND
ncbi:hypothetical protein ACFOEK_14625 [Litoribrevibacter euphylliae]|uniref:Lipoprotein n=1 Tax=Litoribrevibacter euphylliae TaxID=1834034 RepID=A0ABV7HEJ3_9GAMM